ncbi:hypothetical protein [Alteromonas sp. 14N.309.X.WAT.G.H12]|uniref:hypothetical protein n=1 Tax=Alteromonas sp. 14N.309.X.WAT.G.H12 TaxID=3120824 RepID=UPI002FD3EC83
MENRKRKRGVKASRQKLEAAMIRKGFATQIQLARRIAELENLAHPPKDLINKVFREQPVAFANLTRIAMGLEVEAHTLIMAGDDPALVTLVQTPHPTLTSSPWADFALSWLLVPVPVVMLVGHLLWLAPQAPNSGAANEQLANIAGSIKGNPPTGKNDTTAHVLVPQDLSFNPVSSIKACADKLTAVTSPSFSLSHRNKNPMTEYENLGNEVYFCLTANRDLSTH